MAHTYPCTARDTYPACTACVCALRAASHAARNLTHTTSPNCPPSPN